MKKLLENIKYISLIGILALLAASIAAFGWGAAKTVKVIAIMVTSYGQNPLVAVSLMQVVDAFLIATILFVFAASMYELFIGDLTLPAWMLAHDLHELKAKLSSVIIVIMAVVFLEHVVEWKDAKAALLFGLAIALVSAALIALSHFGGKD